MGVTVNRHLRQLRDDRGAEAMALRRSYGRAMALCPGDLEDVSMDLPSDLDTAVGSG
jgi:hypothetical protein